MHCGRRNEKRKESVRYGHIEIEGEGWKWDDSKEELKNWKGERRTVKDEERRRDGK